MTERSATEKTKAEDPANLPPDISPEQSEELRAALERAALEQVEYEELMLIHVGDRDFLVRVNQAEEVVRPQPLTSVPMAPNHLLGVCNVHGLVVCVVDPLKILNIKGASSSDPSLQRFVLYKHPRMKVGLRVDEVSRVFQVRQDQIPEGDGRRMICGKVTIDGVEYPLLDLHVMFQ